LEYQEVRHGELAGPECRERPPTGSAGAEARGYEKNTALMLPPPGSKAEQGFIPDSVVGNPEELVWGRPYRFIEVKGRAEMSLTGNLAAMD
jgi:hypothetical protein